MNKLIRSIEPFLKLPKSIHVLFFASLINYMGCFVGPFLTMFLTYKAGISVEIVGLIVAINSGLGLLGTMIGGKLIDTIGRKKVLMIFRTLSAIGYGSCAFVKDPFAITTILLLSNFLGGFSEPVYSTITTDLTTGEERKAAFSLNYIALNAGFAVGTLIAGFLYENYLVVLFLGDALTTILSVIFVSIFVPETMPTKESIKATISKEERAEEGNLWSALLKRPALLIFCFNITIFFIVFSQFNFGLSLQVADIFNERGSVIFGSLMTINAVICSFFTVVITSITKDVKSSLGIAIGGILYAVGFGMIFFINTYFMFIVSTFIWTLGEILITTNTSVFIAEHTPITHRGRFNAIFPIIRRIGFMAGPFIGGIFIKYTNIRNLWLFVAILSVVGTLFMYKLYTIDKNKNKLELTESV